MRLGKLEREEYADCQGHCQVCFYDGGCDLQDKLRGMTKEQIREELERC